MQAKFPESSDRSIHRAAANHEFSSQLRGAAGSTKKSPKKKPAQRQIDAGLASSPRLVAEAARRSSLFGAIGEPAQRKPNQTGLPDGLKAGVEHLSGMNVDDIRVHRGSAEPATLNALAFAQGSDIHLGPGQEHHLPHEAWHAVQQKQGRVRPTIQVNGAPVNDSHSLEHEADVMGRRALQTKVAGQRQS